MKRPKIEDYTSVAGYGRKIIPNRDKAIALLNYYQALEDYCDYLEHICLIKN